MPNIEYRGHTTIRPDQDYGCCEHCVHWKTSDEHNHPTPCGYVLNLADRMNPVAGAKVQTCQARQRPIQSMEPLPAKPAAARYRWRILTDHHAEPGATAPSNANARGMEGPSNADPLLQTNPAKFSLWTDDNELVYSGWIFGDFTGFEPLDDFGAPNFGCSYVKLNGAIL